ncbi:MAG: DNA cytosine methyltransferase [Candidatus Pacebacteria bacterium]|nr:DNA cytosine methyltransferase [Candidatus Paceibacterota bacterium]
MKYTCIDAFSGAGGLSLGLKRAGFDVLFSFDNDPISITTQNMNGKYLGHVSEVNRIEKLAKNGNFAEKVGIGRGDLFLLAGGPPCQGFSIQRIGNDSDNRNDLVLEYARLIGRLRPKFFLLENVPGLLGSRGRKIFVSFLRVTGNSGYHPYVKVLNAEDFGVPQRRRRVFIIGIRNDMHVREFEFPSGSRKRTTVREAIGTLPVPPEDGSDSRNLVHHRRDRLSELNLARIRALRPGQGMENLPRNLLSACHRIGAERIGHRNVYGRMSWDDVSPTITARFDSFTRGKFGHPSQDRSITLREGAILQTFPMDFRFAGNKVDIARQIGNAVPPKMAEIVGKQIINYYESTR